MTTALATAPTQALALPDSFFHTRDNPWCGVGTTLDHPATSLAALDAAGLDWDVEMRPMLYRASDGKVKPIPNRYVTVRMDTDDVLGQVGSNYKVWQNREAFAFADALVDDGGLMFDSGGSYRGQRRIFLVAKLPDTIQVGGEDPYGLYLVLVTAHDGTLSITAYVTHIRLACTNMLRLSLREAKTMWKIRHTSTAEGHLLEARNSLTLTFKANDAFEREMAKLMKAKITESEVRVAVATVLPNSPRRSEKVEQILTVLNESANLTPYKKTRYGALQAFSEWLDWGRDVRSDEARFSVSFDGYGARQRSQLHKILVSS